MNQHSCLKGFTLVELLVTLAILAVVASVGVPSMNSLVERNRLSTTTNEITGLMQFARSLAATRNESVVVCENNGTWTVSRFGTTANPCSQTALRNVVPNTDLTINRSNNALPLVFYSNGTTSAASTFVVCKGTDASTAFRITITPSGSVRAWQRGHNELGAALTSCSAT